MKDFIRPYAPIISIIMGAIGIYGLVFTEAASTGFWLIGGVAVWMLFVE